MASATRLGTGRGFGRERPGLGEERADAQDGDDRDDRGHGRNPARQHRQLAERRAQLDRLLAAGFHADLELALAGGAERERVVDLDADAELGPLVRRDDGARRLDVELQPPVRDRWR